MNKNQLKKISSLAHAKYRKIHGLFIAEGAHIAAELLKSDWETRMLVVTPGAADSTELSAIIKTASRLNVAIEIIAQREFSRLSTTDSPRGILAVIVLPRYEAERLSAQKRILIADGVSDPGNLGTMIRTAAAFGFGGIVTTSGSADIFNPKTVRATQGALFHSIVGNHIETGEIIKAIKPTHKIYALAAHDGDDLKSVRPSGKSALVIGAEIEGVSAGLLGISDKILRIPISGQVESLNAAVAAGIAMYEISGHQPN
jgi:TrmH family RNA methyltransferase